jgi:hypothetical protein
LTSAIGHKRPSSVQLIAVRAYILAPIFRGTMCN